MSHDNRRSQPVTGWLRRMALCTLLVATLPAALAATQPGSASTAPTVRAASAAGLHFIFDASMSMCGYLRGNDPQAKSHKSPGSLLQMIQFATAQSDRERNDRVVLLRQHGIKASRRDLLEPPPDFPAVAARAAVSVGADCSPFDGRDTNPVQVFERPSFATMPRSLVFVSDMQFTEQARTAMLNRFRQIALSRISDEPYSVGIATLGAEFTGPYFPIIDSRADFVRNGYPLPRHVRPLHLLWFLVGTRDLEIGRRLLADVGVQGGPAPTPLLFGMRLMPVASTDPTQWFTALPTPQTPADLFLHAIPAMELRDRSRSGAILAICVKHRWAGDTLEVRLENLCKDGKPFFDGSVRNLKLRLPVAQSHGLRVSVPTHAVAAMTGHLLELSLDRNTPPEVNIPLLIDATPIALDREGLRKLSMTDDSCDAAGAKAVWQKDCAERLSGRTYSFDTLVEQLAMRAQTVLNERATAEKVLKLRIQLQPPPRR